MASLTPANRACIEDLHNFEFSQADGALLMSFLDDTQVLEDCDDERLTSVMRSLEAEIDLHVANDQNSFQDSSWSSNYNNSSSDDEYVQGQEISSSNNILDFNWMDMEMETGMEMVASSPIDGMANWYMDAACGHDIEHDEFGNIDQRDYRQLSNYGISYEDQEYGSYGTLWPETNHASMVHG